MLLNYLSTKIYRLPALRELASGVRLFRLMGDTCCKNTNYFNMTNKKQYFFLWDVAWELSVVSKTFQR